MPERVVVVTPNWLGDAIMALPALQSVRAHYPQAHVAVAARPSVGPMFAMVAGVDAVVPLASRGGVAGLRRWRGDTARLSAERFDIAVLLPNSFLSAWIVAKARIAERWGFNTDWRGPLLTRTPRRPPSHVHQADYYLGMIAGLGMTVAPRVARLEGPPDAVESAARLIGPSAVARGYIVLAPGAAYGRAKQWPPERFAELAATLCRERGVAAVVVGAGADALAGVELRQALASAPRGGASVELIDLIGRTDLPTLAGVLAGARAVVANDSGAMHLAGAVGAPLAAIFGPTNERQTSPLVAALDAPAAQVATHSVWCRPCMLRECPLGHMCMRGVTAAQVVALLP